MSVPFVLLLAASRGAAQEAPVPARSVAAPRPAAAIVAEFDANPSPGFVFDEDPERAEQLIRDRLTKQCDCAWELFEGHPRHARLPELLFARLMNELNFFEDLVRVARDAETLLASSQRADVRVLARYAAAQAALRDERVPSAQVVERVEAALREPGGIVEFEGWRPLLLCALASERTADPARQRELFARARRDAGSDDVRDVIARAEQPLAHLGEPLELAFDDALGSRGTRRFDLALERGHFTIVHVAHFVWGAPGKQFASLRAALPQLARCGAVVVSTVSTLGSEEEDALARNAKAAGVTWPLQVRTEPAAAAGFGVSGSLLGLDPPAFVLVDGEGRVAGIYTRLAPALERLAAPGGAIDPQRPRRRAY